MNTEQKPETEISPGAMEEPLDNDRQPATGGRGLRTVAISFAAAVLLLALTLCGLVVWQSLRSPRPSQSSVPRSSHHGHLDKQTFGAEAAKVKVIAALPLATGCQRKRVEYLLTVARACPDHLQVRFLDMKEASGRQALEQHSLKCASAIVNGNTTFALESASGVRHVVLQGPSDEKYTLADLRAVLQQQLIKAYGQGAPVLSPVPQTEPERQNAGPAS